MYRIIQFIIFISLFPSLAIGQNLVPNGNFEDTVFCPVQISGMYGEKIYGLTNWFPAGYSPDFFHSCSPYSPTTGQASQPQNGMGYQVAHSGNGYIGLTTYISNFPNGREYVGVQLNSQLQIGVKYYFQMFLSCADGGVQGMNTFTNNMGVKLSNVYYESQANPLYPNNDAYAHSSQILTDTANWVPLIFELLPDSNYNYLYLGNFFDDVHTDTLNFPVVIGSKRAYMYIDNVLLTTDSSLIVGVKEVSEKKMNTFDVYPNPTKGILYIEGPPNKYYIIFDQFGREIKTFRTSANAFTINLSDYADGAYFITDINGLYKRIIINK